MWDIQTAVGKALDRHASRAAWSDVAANRMGTLSLTALEALTGDPLGHYTYSTYGVEARQVVGALSDWHVGMLGLRAWAGLPNVFAEGESALAPHAHLVAPAVAEAVFTEFWDGFVEVARELAEEESWCEMFTSIMGDIWRNLRTPGLSDPDPIHTWYVAVPCVVEVCVTVSVSARTEEEALDAVTHGMVTGELRDAGMGHFSEHEVEVSWDVLSAEQADA
jgi:hypothetical protein